MAHLLRSILYPSEGHPHHLTTPPKVTSFSSSNHGRPHRSEGAPASNGEGGPVLQGFRARYSNPEVIFDQDPEIEEPAASRFVADNILGGFDPNQQLHEDNCDVDAAVNGNAAFVPGPGSSSFVPRPESSAFVPGPESAASGNVAEEAADEISSQPVVPYVGMIMGCLGNVRGGDLRTLGYVKRDVSNIRTMLQNDVSLRDMSLTIEYFEKRKAESPSFFYATQLDENNAQQPDQLQEDIQLEQHEAQQPNNEAHGNGNLRNPPRNKPKGCPKETEKRHKPLVELRDEANKKRQKKASEPKSKKEPAAKVKRKARVKKCPYCNEEGHTIQECMWMKLARQADEAKAAGVELRLYMLQ
ncbi:hypothetical protein ACQ4PT_042476 [Festuca glaucescens]